MNAAVVRAKIESALGERFPRALTPAPAVSPAVVRIGIPALDTMTGGLPRGALTEITGPPSSGRSGVLYRALAAISQAGEFCALVDTTDNFDPESAASAGVCLERMLWVRCSERTTTSKHTPGKRTLDRIEQALRVTDLLLQNGGFGLIALELGSVPQESARRIPLTTWFRFRRAVEKTPAILLVLESQANAKTCASLVLEMKPEGTQVSTAVKAGITPPSHGRVFRELHVQAEIARSSLGKKPVQSIRMAAKSVEYG